MNKKNQSQQEGTDNTSTSSSGLSQKIARPVLHPGAIFQTKFVDQRQTTLVEAARSMDVAYGVLALFVAGKTLCDEWLADRLARYTGWKARTWLRKATSYQNAQKKTQA